MKVDRQDKHGITVITYKNGRKVKYICSIYTNNLVPLNPEDEEPCEHFKQGFLAGLEAERKKR